MRDRIIDLALDKPELSPRELAVTFTDVERYFVSEASVYRLLKANDLITSPAFIVIKAANEFKDKTTASNQLWQTDFTYLKVIGWGWCDFGLPSEALRTVFRRARATFALPGLALFRSRCPALALKRFFVIETFSGSGSDHRCHHRSAVTANRPTGQVQLAETLRPSTPTVAPVGPALPVVSIRNLVIICARRTNSTIGKWPGRVPNTKKWGSGV